MKLLVSPISLEEAIECVKGRADIIDVKNPAEGSLGANFPWIIQTIRKEIPLSIPVSATIGDVPFKPGSVALAALGAIYCGVSYVKVGLPQIHNVAEGVEIMSAVKKTVETFQSPVKIVVAGYAEGESNGFIDPLLIPDIAAQSSCEVAMLDTFSKENGKSLFDYLSIDILTEFISKAKEYNLTTALGGSLKIEHIPLLKELQPDIIGIRGAACEQGDRINGSIKAELITNFLREMVE
ncbi:MAG: (5-formylfuran-3-yl)methyl phosphate synthase [Candidatus Heimdallarchaeota archaeon]